MKIIEIIEQQTTTETVYAVMQDGELVTVVVGKEALCKTLNDLM